MAIESFEELSALTLGNYLDMVVEEAQKAAGPQRGQDLLALLRSSPGGVVDLGGKTVWLKGGLRLRDEQGATIMNGTLPDGFVYLEGSRRVGPNTTSRICLRNLTFRGPGKPAVAEPIVDGYGISNASLVSVRGAVGVVIEGCTFVGAARSAEWKGLDRPVDVNNDKGVLTAGLHVRTGSVRVENCCFVDNDGPGVWAGCGCHVAAVTVRNSRFGGNRYCDVAAAASGDVELEGCVLASACRVNLLGMAQGHVRARGTTFCNRHAGASVSSGSTAELERCTFDGCPILALGGELTATDVTVTGVPKPMPGVMIADGARGTVRGAKISGSTGLVVCGGRLVASGVVCRDNADMGGVVVGRGGFLLLERSTLCKNLIGICVVGQGSTVEAADVELHDNVDTGVCVQEGGSVKMRGCSISGGRCGIVVSGTGGARATAKDTDISGCATACVAAQEGARVALEGGRVTDSKGPGIVVNGAETRVTVSKVACARNAGGDYVRDEGGSVVGNVVVE
ncbi:unnamed protein product [Pedinophyceae sp. YPF-701]|nr:unnamed protein product [Pedinophyceae sp. YPF-701]